MKQSKQLLLANRAWAVELTDENADFFSRSVASQKPEFMWIGCSGSRVSPEQKTQTLPGRMVIHSNIANLVNPEDLNLMSTLQHAIDVLAVPNIIVCGHHGCGGIRATLSGSATGPVKHWLEPANAALHDHADEINSLPPGEAQVNRLVEVNVRDQLVNLARTETVQAAFARGQELTLHGWVYDIRDGQLKPLMEITRDTVLDEVGRPDPVLTV